VAGCRLRLEAGEVGAQRQRPCKKGNDAVRSMKRSLRRSTKLTDFRIYLNLIRQRSTKRSIRSTAACPVRRGWVSATVRLDFAGDAWRRRRRKSGSDYRALHEVRLPPALKRISRVACRSRRLLRRGPVGSR